MNPAERPLSVPPSTITEDGNPESFDMPVFFTQIRDNNPAKKTLAFEALPPSCPTPRRSLNELDSGTHPEPSVRLWVKTAVVHDMKLKSGGVITFEIAVWPWAMIGFRWRLRWSRESLFLFRLRVHGHHCVPLRCDGM
jgi:hypothetical protein